jgi:hypothetical protein
MNKSVLGLAISAFVVLLLVLTNPSIEAHKEAVKARLNTVMQSTLKEQAATMERGGGLVQGLGLLFGGTLLDGIVNTGVTRNNYLLFSTTNFTYSGETKTIGVGVLGNVFFSSKVDEAMTRSAKKE